MPVVFGGGNCDVVEGKGTKFRAPLKGGDLDLYFRWDKALPNMLTERDLLTDIIANTPSGSIWNITEDSWERFPEVFSEWMDI